MERRIWRRHKEPSVGLDPERALAQTQMLISPKWTEMALPIMHSFLIAAPRQNDNKNKKKPVKKSLCGENPQLNHCPSWKWNVSRPEKRS